MRICMIIIAACFIASCTDDNGSGPKNSCQTCASAEDIAFDRPVLASLDGPDDFHYYHIHVDSTGTYMIYTRSDLDTVGTLLDSECQTYYENDDRSDVDYNFRIIKRLSPGDYYIKVMQFENYDEEYAFEAYAGTYELVAREIFLEDETISLALNSDSSESFSADSFMRYYTLDATTAGSLALYTTGDLDTAATLFDADFEVLAQVDDVYSGDYNFFINELIGPGRYYLMVEEVYEDTGSYTLTVDFAADGTTTVSSILCYGPETFSVDATIAGSMEQAADYTTYAVAVPENGTYIFYTSGGLDTSLILSDSQCQLIASSEDLGASNTNSGVFVYLDTGTYHVTISADSSGSYILNAETIEDQ